MWLWICSCRQFQNTFENPLLKKIILMQPIRLCICSSKKFEDTFEISLQKQIIQGKPVQLCICSGRQFDHIWKFTPEKSRANATNATMHVFWQAIWEDIWKLILEKNRQNATIACFASVHSDNLRMHLKTHSGERSFNYASVLAGNVRKLLKIHSREKSYTCNRCDFPSVHSYDLQAMRLCIISGRQFEKTFKILLWRKILKTHSWAQLAQHLFTHSGEKTHHCGLWDKQEIWKSTSSFTLEKNPSNAQNAHS